MKLTNRPKLGDIFFGEKEFNIGRKKDDDDNIIEVCVTKQDCFIKKEKQEVFFSKNKAFKNEREVTIDNSSIDETRSQSVWIVEYIKQADKLKLIYSTIPEMYLIRARRLTDDEWTPKGEVIEFYTIGNNVNLYKNDLEIIINIKDK